MEKLITDDGIELNEEQVKAILEVENTTQNYFITGKAGTGKSLLLQYFVSNTKKRVAVVAPTGISAIKIKGQTIHSLFGLKPCVQNPYDPNETKIDVEKSSLLKNLDVLIIDEISMVRCDVMDMIDKKLRIAREMHDEPFGGCQIIVFGDLYQLPPVIEKDKWIQTYIQNNYGSEFFFSSPCIQKSPFKIIELNCVHRQNDSKFIDVLNRIRVGENNEYILNYLNKRCIQPPHNSHYLTLTTTRAAADLVNREKLKSLHGIEYSYYGEVDGDFESDEMPTDAVLTLKVGAQIMMVKNDAQKRWVNGSVGIISELSSNLIKVDIKGIKYSVDKESWTKYQYVYDEEKHTIKQVSVGSFKQFPIKLAYAITIHKSQGQTYEAVMIDYSSKRAFVDGQTYVALSRCKSYEGVFLKDSFVAEDIKVNQNVVDFTNGNYHIETKKATIEDIKVLYENSKQNIQWLSDNRIQIQSLINPKKITGSRFSAILEKDKYKTPFAVWCALTRTYEEPFTENKYTRAGKIIEPKQFEYVNAKMSNSGTMLISPEAIYGTNPGKNMGYDFFKENEVFGGMWDYILKEGDKTVAVMEMKTTNIRNKSEWDKAIPESNKLQAALYAWLLDVDDIYMVSSFLDKNDYGTPANYNCNDSNTIITHFKLSKEYPNFEEECVVPAMEWWSDYVETGISPSYDNKDEKIISYLKRNI